ncbi:MAG: HAD family hydrolase [Actinobacteria bacterium]|nr:HAD family hydrolase [Actinomycetota bacterium]
MFRAILFDLDGTLLDIDSNRFFPDYLATVGGHFARFAPPERFVELILRSTRAMIENRDPALTNRQVFVRSFFPALGREPEELMPLFDEFYRDVFPRLAHHGRPAAGARRTLEKAAARGVKLVVATNPIFPESAVRERLRWGGVDDLPYELVTAYEAMHFCKPHREYFEEVLGMIGAGPAECLMVGNDGVDDMAASRAGIKTFLVEERAVRTEGSPFRPDMRGGFGELERLVDGGAA